jgi:Orotidine 5'-phosphate decarboxylase / HUMPS family
LNASVTTSASAIRSMCLSSMPNVVTLVPRAEHYATEAFVRYGADAVTVNAYLGGDSVEPFLRHEGKGVILLCRTSNPGSDDV